MKRTPLVYQEKRLQDWKILRKEDFLRNIPNVYSLIIYLGSLILSTALL